MGTEEIKCITELLEAFKRRKHERKLQLARLGVSADPVISTEIRDIEEQARVQCGSNHHR